jgi:heterodisulfide reductase subunit D
VDALISACPWSERPLSEAADGRLEVMDLFELVAQSAGIEVGGRP